MKKLLVWVFVFTAIFSRAQEVSIFIDGNTDDWGEEYCEEYIDLDNDGGQLELLSLKVSNDEKNLYLSFKLANELLLNKYNNLKLYIDGDNNSATGFAIENIGADLIWKFGDREGTYYNNGSQQKIFHNNLSYVSLPTVTSTDFEISIALDAKPDGETQLFSSDKINIVLADTDSDQIPNTGEELEYTINHSLHNSFQAIDVTRDEQTDIRMMTYNVLHEGIIDPERQEYFTRIFKSVNPDIITFNECWDVTEEQAKEVLDEAIPTGTVEGWYTVKRDHGSITCTRYEIMQSWEVNPGRRMTAVLINVPDNRSDRDILVVNAHLKCCDADDIRQREADAFASFIIDAQTPGGVIDLPENTPFLLAGDLNLVGDQQPLRTLTHGEIVNTLTYGNGRLLDWDNTPLEDVISSHIDEPTAYTWRNNHSSYWPGRLDFTIISNSALEVRNSFTLQTETLAPELLQEMGLHAEDTEKASDHLPKITDLKIIESSMISDIVSKILIYPNPAKDIISIIHNNIDITNLSFVNTQSGMVYKANITSQKKSVKTIVNTTSMPRGLYIIKMKINNDYYVYKKVVLF